MKNSTHLQKISSTISTITTSTITYDGCIPCFESFGAAFLESLEQNGSKTSSVPESTTVAPSSPDLGFCQKSLILKPSILYPYALILAFTLILLLAAIRKRKFGGFCWGHPGLVYPVNLLQDYKNRFTISAAFGLTAWQMLSLILGSNTYPFPLQHRIMEFKPFYVLAACLIYAFLYYPIFACLSAKNLVSYGLGTFYVWVATIFFIINNRYCWNGDKRALALDLIEDFPAWFCLIWLCAIFSFRFLTKLKNFQCGQKFENFNEFEFQKKLVKELFQKKNFKLKQSGLFQKWFHRLIYQPISGLPIIKNFPINFFLFIFINFLIFY